MKKYLLIILLTTGYAYSQDTLKVKLKKNHFGISLSPAIIGYIGTYSFPLLFTTSFYLEYNRILSKRIWLTGGAGIFTSGHYSELNGYMFKDNNDPLINNYQNYKSFLYNYNFGFHLKPKLIIIDKKILFYAGLSTQMNFYLTSLSIVNYYDNNNNKIRETETSFNNQYESNSIYGGVISGIGYNHRRFLFIVEPEFKVSITSIVNNYNLNFYLPYALGINLLAYYKF